MMNKAKRVTARAVSASQHSSTSRASSTDDDPAQAGIGLNSGASGYAGVRTGQD
jgi:hypothetical protein